MTISGLRILIYVAAFITNEDDACRGQQRKSSLLLNPRESNENTETADAEAIPMTSIQQEFNKLIQEETEMDKTWNLKTGKFVEEVMRNSPGPDSEKFLFFFGKKTIYSNFCPSKFTIDETKFACAEQYFHYAKALRFKDYDTAKKIVASTSPDEQKKLGREVKDYDDDVWESAGLESMAYVVREKFQQNADMKKELLSTVGLTLVEASPYDQKWGIGMNIKSKNTVYRSRWRGKNLLGPVLMEVRDEFLTVPALGIITVKETEVLAEINRVREAANAGPATWDEWLAKFAERRARKSCRVDLPNQPRPFKNKAGFLVVEESHLSGNSDNFKWAILQWVQKGKNQDISETDECSGDDDQHCIAYQRMVSTKNTHVGCAFVDCHNEHTHPRRFFCEWGANELLSEMKIINPMEVDSATLQKTFEKFHNYIRTLDVMAAAMQKVRWNIKLAEFAEKKANDSCTKFVRNSFRKVPDFEENLVILLNWKSVTEKEAKEFFPIVAWTRASVHYEEKTGKCWKSGYCGAYKWVVRETVTDIGCAIVKCPPKTPPAEERPRTHRVVEEGEVDKIHTEPEPRHHRFSCAYAPYAEPKEVKKLGSLAYIVGEPASDCEKYGRVAGTGEDAGLCVEQEGQETNDENEIRNT